MERDVINRAVPKIKCISTHTLTWSVTYLYGTGGSYHRHFNSHAHVERDVEDHAKVFLMVDFNSHAHVERDAGIGQVS